MLWELLIAALGVAAVAIGFDLFRSDNMKWK